MTRQIDVDDARLLALLWTPERTDTPRPGPKAQLSLQSIIHAGIAIASDRSGPELSMRLVAEQLGCTPMALYSYVDGKSTLLRLMYDAAHAEFSPADGAASTKSIHEWARALADLYAKHYWLADVSWSRPVLGPYEQEALESLLRRLQFLSLRPAQEGTVASSLLALCRNTGRLIADSRHAARTSGKSDEQWWSEQSVVMSELVPDFRLRFPLSARVETATPVKELGDEATTSYLERSAWAQLDNAVRLIVCGVSHDSD